MSRSLKVLRASLAVTFLAIASVAAAASNSEQLVFSGTGSGTFTPAGGTATNTPFGFWIWCEVESNNKYVGECHGSMYFYGLGITRAVEDAGEDAITELSEGIYSVSVVDKKGQGAVIACTLTNESGDHGPHNVIDVSCSAPAGSGQAPNSVVNVTGP
jgi:hypothetical protein